MQNLLTEFQSHLKKDKRFVTGGKLLKNKIIELSLQPDPEFINLLLENEDIKKHFFTKTGKALVFDKIRFQKFVSTKAFLPNSYTAFKNKIGLIKEDEYLSENKEVILAWPYKDCLLEGGQTKEDTQKEEIFWNETLAPKDIDRLLAPKVFNNFKRFSNVGIEEVTAFTSNENYLLKGNNLIVLHSLLKKRLK